MTDDRDWPCGCQSRRSGDDVLTLLCPEHAAEMTNESAPPASAGGERPDVVGSIRSGVSQRGGPARDEHGAQS